MSLYPGNPRLVNPNDPVDEYRYALDEKALTDTKGLADSMALAIEDAMANVFEKVKGTPIPEVGMEDRRLLYVAISRGILQYLADHQGDLSSTVGGQINLNISMDR